MLEIGPSPPQPYIGWMDGDMFCWTFCPAFTRHVKDDLLQVLKKGQTENTFHFLKSLQETSRCNYNFFYKSFFISYINCPPVLSNYKMFMANVYAYGQIEYVEEKCTYPFKIPIFMVKDLV